MVVGMLAVSMKALRALLLSVVLASACSSLPQDELFKALSKRDLGETKRLLDEHPDWPRKTDRYGLAPLMMASRNNDLEAVKLLIERGALVNYQEGRDGYTALMVAASVGHHEVTSFLISKGAYIELANRRGERAITLAAMRGHAGAVRVLLASKAQVNFPDGGMPPLNAAIDSGNYDTVVAIVEAGAELNKALPKAKGPDLWPKPLSLARIKKLAAIDAYLVSKGATE